METNLNDAINAQINTELWSAYLFLSMSVNASSKSLKVVADWFYVQHQKELMDAKILIDYLNSINSKVYLYPIDGVPIEWNSALEMFEHKLEHERKILKLLHAITTIAEERNECATVVFLKKIAKKQLKVEAETEELIAAFMAAESNINALYMLDGQLMVM